MNYVSNSTGDSSAVLTGYHVFRGLQLLSTAAAAATVEVINGGTSGGALVMRLGAPAASVGSFVFSDPDIQGIPCPNGIFVHSTNCVGWTLLYD